MSAGATWAGTHRFTAPRLVEARSVEEVQRAITAGGPVRALGTRHSFSDLADTAGTLVTVTGIAPQPSLDVEQRQVTVGAGASYGELAGWLESRGWALHNLGSLPHISIGGAIATGTHGSGFTNGSLASAVAGLEYVDSTGALSTVTRSDPDFEALVVGLGAYGIAVRITLDVQPTYSVRQDVYSGMTWDALLANLDSVLGAAYSVSVFTFWGRSVIDQVWCKSRIDAGAAVPDALLDAHRRTQNDTQIAGGDVSALTPQAGVAGPWLDRLPHFRLEATPSNGDEIQTEYFVDRQDGAAALQAVRVLAESIDPLLLITELRTVARDQLWLSGAYGRDTLGIHFTWKNMPAQVREVLPQIEAALAPFAARPHWGKWHAFDASRLEEVWERHRDARELFDQLDPQRVFSNDHLVRVGLRTAQ